MRAYGPYLVLTAGIALVCTVAASCGHARPTAMPRLVLGELNGSPAFLKLRAPDGLIRFAQVDDRVYRGGQPTIAQIAELKALGVTTILSLRSEAEAVTAAERRETERLGMRFVNVPITSYYGVDKAQAERVLAALKGGGDKDVVYVHCKIGRDRTSFAVALHLVAHHGWDPKLAWQRAALDFGHEPTFWDRGLDSTFQQRAADHFHHELTKPSVILPSH